MNANAHPSLRQVSVAILLAALSMQAMAEEEALPEYTFMDAIKTGKNMTSFRLRYENVQQDGLQPPTYANGSPNPGAAKDLKDAVDYYWIRSYRNDTLHRLEDNFSIDGSYDEGVSDGATFILPIAEGITDYDKPFQAGEKAIVKLFSLTHSSYDFLTQVNNQVNAGGLFAKVLENVKSNVHNTTSNGKVKILGWFGTSAVTRAEKEAK